MSFDNCYDGFDRMFDRFLNYYTNTSNNTSDSNDASVARFYNNTNMPLMNVYDTSKETVIHVELPGLKSGEIENMDLNVTGKTLTISGEYKQKKEYEKAVSKCLERRYGKFKRTLSLPEGSKTDDIKATYKDGVLIVNVPKGEPEGQKKITIQ